MRMKARTQQNRLWNIKPVHPQTDQFAKVLKVSSLTANILLNRKICEHQQGMSFLNPKLTELADPLSLPGIQDAVTRIIKAVQSKEKITIYGDYDVDGITSTTILYKLFELFETPVDFYIPHRIDEGYGLNSEAIEQIAESGTNLIITVDCGISSIDEVEKAKQLGMDIIITDHHRLGEKLPRATAIVHPNLKEHGNKNICAGAMVAFKLAWAVANELKKGGKIDDQTRQFLLDATIFAALGTIADVISLTGENRAIASFGLNQLTKCQLPGIVALKDVAEIKDKTIDSQDVSFLLAPMLNAAGRMGHARLAVELLTCDNDVRSYRIAQYLKEQNKLRQKHERDIFKNACEIISVLKLDHPDRKTIVISSDNWHQGVIGIVASRIVEKYYRPTILINTTNGTGCGSGRSIEGFNLLNAINSGASHLIRFGGHDMAAGVTLETSKINDFAQAVEEYAQNNFKDIATAATLDIDALCSIGDFNHHIIKELNMLAPFGQGNPKPIFASKGVRLVAKPRTVGSRSEHIQLGLADKTGTIRAVGFNMACYEKKIIESDFFNIAYQPQINTYNGNFSVEFILSDIQFE